MEKIEVVIPKQIFFRDHYLDIKNCYLHNALTKAGFEVAYVSEGSNWGFLRRNERFSIVTMEDGSTWKTTRPFNLIVVMDAFGWGKNIPVTLVKI